jgi:hypothetical protein
MNWSGPAAPHVDRAPDDLAMVSIARNESLNATASMPQQPDTLASV